jgi:iron complex outermembrane receptor protein
VGPFELGASYNYAHYRFREFVVDTTDYAGNSIPGIPASQLQLSATWRHQALFVTAEADAQSSVFVNDGNTARADGYTTLNLRLGATSLFGNPWISPIVGVENLFNTSYVGSVAVNATRGKFFEPAPGRVVFAGMALAIGR